MLLMLMWWRWLCLLRLWCDTRVEPTAATTAYSGKYRKAALSLSLLGLAASSRRHSTTTTLVSFLFVLMVVESTTIHTKIKEKRKHTTDKRLAWQNSHMKQKHCLKKDGNKRDMQCECGKKKKNTANQPTEVHTISTINDTARQQLLERKNKKLRSVW